MDLIGGCLLLTKADIRHSRDLSAMADTMIISTFIAGLARMALKQAREGGAMSPTHSS
jgi:hypothetical protein